MRQAQTSSYTDRSRNIKSISCEPYSGARRPPIVSSSPTLLRRLASIGPSCLDWPVSLSDPASSSPTPQCRPLRRQLLIIAFITKTMPDEISTSRHATLLHPHYPQVRLLLLPCRNALLLPAHCYLACAVPKLLWWLSRLQLQIQHHMIPNSQTNDTSFTASWKTIYY